jgi:hypothetical protein
VTELCSGRGKESHRIRETGLWDSGGIRLFRREKGDDSIRDGSRGINGRCIFRSNVVRIIDEKWALAGGRVDLHVSINARKAEPPHAVVIGGMGNFKLPNDYCGQVLPNPRGDSVNVSLHLSILQHVSNS